MANSASAAAARIRQQEAYDNDTHSKPHDKSQDIPSDYPSGESVTTISAVDLTKQNAVQSPLLRLPAELRNAIWKFTYSNIWLDVRARRFLPRRRSFLYFEGPTPGLVCKQHWAEVIPIFLETCTFAFNDDSAFQEFLTTGSSVLAHVRRLAFHVDLSLYIGMSTARDWANTLRKVSHLSDELERLEGVQISAKSWVIMPWTRQPFAVSGEPSVWEVVGLSGMVRFFQHYKLKEELTSCEVTGFEKEGDMKRLRMLSSEVRDHLLDYKGYAGMEE